jgi:protein TonB
VTALAVPPAIRPADRLSLTFCLALLVHAVIVLGVSFAPEQHPELRYETMDIILVQEKSETPPDAPDFLAQANLQGGGEEEEAERPSTPFAAAMPDTTAELTAPPPAPPPSAAAMPEALPEPVAQPAPVPEMEPPEPATQMVEAVAPPEPDAPPQARAAAATPETPETPAPPPPVLATEAPAPEKVPEPQPEPAAKPAAAAKVAEAEPP